jgi:hypothetical protein
MDFPNSTITSNNSQDKDLLAQSSQINEDARNDSSI